MFVILGLLWYSDLVGELSLAGLVDQDAYGILWCYYLDYIRHQLYGIGLCTLIGSMNWDSDAINEFSSIITRNILTSFQSFGDCFILDCTIFIGASIWLTVSNWCNFSSYFPVPHHYCFLIFFFLLLYFSPFSYSLYIILSLGL